MVESNATIRLRAVDTNVVSTINNVSAASTNALIGATALAGGFGLLEKVTRTSGAQMALGASKADLLANSFSKLSSTGSKATQALGAFSTAIYTTQQVAIAADGIGKAAQAFARLPQAMQAMQASGVSTYTIQQFGNLAEAIKGSDIALDSLLVSSIAELGEFEQAAARAGTILKSSLRFDDTGNALTANSQERLENALSVQRLVNTELDNAVTSTAALTGQYEVLSSGFTSAKESQQVLKEGLKLVKIGETGGKAVNTTATLQLLTKALNAYELQAADAGKVAAVLNGIVENGLTTIQELSLGFGRTSAQASKANIALVDVGAATAVLTSQGVSTAESLSGIARVSASIVSKTPEAEKALAKLQLRGEKIRFDKQEIQAKGFTQALVDLYDAAGGSSEVLSQIFPEDVAFRTVNALLTEQGRRLQETKVKIEEADEAKLNEIFEIAKSDRVARLVQLSNRFKESIIEIGLALAPTLEPGIRALETIANRFAGLPEPARKAIGSFLAFRIGTKAAGGAVKILIDTLIKLATNYLTVRLISLALTGQLGKEAKAVKALITQKKGLAAATLQLFGVDQKWRLEQESATAAIAKQSKVAAAATAAKNKVVQTAKTAVVTGVSATSGITKEQVVSELQRRKDQAIVLAQSGIAKGKEYAQQLADRYGFQLPAFAAPTIAQPPKPSAPVPQQPFGFQPLKQKPVPQQPFSFQTLKPQPVPRQPFGFLPLRKKPEPAVLQDQFSFISALKPTPPTAFESNLNNLIAQDKALAKASSDLAAQQESYDKLRKQKKSAKTQTTEARKGVTKAEVELEKAKNKAIATGNDLSATAEQREQALNAVTQKQNQLQKANNLLSEKESKLQKTNTATLIQQNRAKAAENVLDQAQLNAKTKYAPLAKAITEAEKANAKALQLSQAEKIAKIKAEGLEATAGAKARVTLIAKRDAYLAEIQAKNASTIATKKNAIAENLATNITKKAQLAEKGYYEAILFGNKVKLSQVGLIGAINKILTTNISVSNAAAAAEVGVGKAKAGVVAVSKLLNAELLIESGRLAAIKGIRSLESAFLLLKGGTKNAIGAIKTLAAPLGALAPLLAVTGVGVIALRSEIFGLGGDVRKLSKDYKNFVKEQEKLNSSLNKQIGLTQVEGLLKSDETISTRVEAASKELVRLKDTGAITTAEFTRLNAKLANTDDAEKGIKALTTEIARLKAGVVDIEKGIIDRGFDLVKKIPSNAAKSLDFIVNLYAAAQNSIAKQELVLPSDIAADREASSIITATGLLGAVQEDAGKRFFETKVAIADYRQSLALTSEVQTKVAKGIKLTNEDIKNEEQTFKAKADENRSVIDKLENDIDKQKEIAAKIKNEDNKKILENQIQQTVRQKEALEAENDALKQLQEDTKIYLTQTLPAIQKALQENSNPALALTNAREEFNQAFIEDAEGNTTKLLKPLETLQAEAGKLVGQIQESLSFGLLDDLGSGEIAAAEQIKAVRDDQISFMENGELVTRYRLKLPQRRELTSQIVQLENADLKRAEAKNQIETDLIKALSQARLETTEATNLKLAQMQNEAIANRIAQKEKEIAEFKALGLRTIDDEIELERLRVQQRSTGFSLQNAELAASLSNLKFRQQQEDLVSQQALFASKQLVSQIQNEGVELKLNLEIIKEELNFRSQLAQLSNAISKNQVFNAQVQSDLAIKKLKNLKASIPIEREQLENSISITKENNKQRLLQAQQQESSAELALVQAQKQLELAKENDASKEKLDRLRLEIDNRKFGLQQAKETVNQAEIQITNQEKLSDRQREQLETSNNLQLVQANQGISAAQRLETEAQINREYQLRSQYLSGRSQEAAIANKERNSIVSFRTGELSLAAQLTNKEREKLKIARQLAQLKLISLKSQLQSEAQVLALNQKQQKLQFISNQEKNQAALQQNLADVLKVQANLSKLEATGASKEEIAAEKAQLDAQLAQRQVLVNESRRQQEEGKRLSLQQKVDRESFERSSRLKIDQARVEAIGALPESQQKSFGSRLQKELLRSSGVGISNPALGQTIDNFGQVKIEVPQISIPKIEFPSIEDISKNVQAIVSEFNVKKDNALNSFEGEGRKFVIENLSMDAPISININGADDKEAIAEQVEGAVFNQLTDVMRGVENKLNEI